MSGRHKLPITWEEQKLADAVILRLREARRARGMSQRDLAVLSNMSQPQISEIERGRYFPTLVSVVRLCSAMGLELVLVDEWDDLRRRRTEE